jgi:hypothetical protein
MECELLDTCGFFTKYHESKDMSCQTFIRVYCQGEKRNECKRKKFSAKYGISPLDNMMPHGTMVFSSTH